MKPHNRIARYLSDAVPNAGTCVPMPAPLRKLIMDAAGHAGLDAMDKALRSYGVTDAAIAVSIYIPEPDD